MHINRELKDIILDLIQKEFENSKIFERENQYISTISMKRLKMKNRTKHAMPSRSKSAGIVR